MIWDMVGKIRKDAGGGGGTKKRELGRYFVSRARGEPACHVISLLT
jgi:hypothetical protein